MAENDDLAIAKWQANQLVERILKDINASDHMLFLSGSDNFRYNIYPEYKANRRDMVRPRHLEAVREDLLSVWNSHISYGCEADDEIGVVQSSEDNTIICSTDKDLNMIPGMHYNFIKQEMYDVSFREARYNFWFQMLVGDPADNIKGCPGIGKAKAPAILDTKHPAEAVLGMYIEALKEYPEAKRLFDMNGKVLWIWRKPDDIWEPPKMEVTELN